MHLANATPLYLLESIFLGRYVYNQKEKMYIYQSYLDDTVYRNPDYTEMEIHLVDIYSSTMPKLR